MTPLDVLKGARELLSDEKRWTKGALARDKDGHETGIAVDPDAVCWCAYGAIEHCNKEGYGAEIAMNRVVRGLGWPSIGAFNDADSTTHADVLALFDRAIASLEGGAP